MNNLLKIVLFGGAALYVIDKIGLASVGSSLKIRISGFDIQSGGIVLKLAADNPRDVGFIIYSIVGSLYIGSNLIGDVSMFSQIQVAPLASTTIPILIRPSILGSLTLLQQAIQGQINLTTPIGFKANVNANNTLLPVDISYQYKTA